MKERHKERTIERGITEAVEAECAIVKEVADVSRLGGHGAEGVGTAGGEGVHADQQHVHQQGPGVAVRQEVQRRAQDAEAPQEVPGRNTGCCCCSGSGAGHRRYGWHSAASRCGGLRLHCLHGL